MNENAIPDFTEAEQKLVSAMVLRRYDKLIPLQLADSELQLAVDSEVLTSCPTLYWNERGAHFVICKVAGDRYRCQFFYSDAEQYGTLENCVKTLLQVQSDHERQLSNISSGATAASLDEDYHGPLMV